MPPLPNWYRGHEAIAGFLQKGPNTVRWGHLRPRQRATRGGGYTWDEERPATALRPRRARDARRADRRGHGLPRPAVFAPWACRPSCPPRGSHARCPVAGLALVAGSKTGWVREGSGARKGSRERRLRRRAHALVVKEPSARDSYEVRRPVGPGRRTFPPGVHFHAWRGGKFGGRCATRRAFARDRDLSLKSRDTPPPRPGRRRRQSLPLTQPVSQPRPRPRARPEQRGWELQLGPGCHRSWRTDSTLPAGSLNHAMYGPSSRKMPFSSWSNPS